MPAKRRKWPTSLPPVRRPKTTAEIFKPPVQGQSWTPPSRDFLPLPAKYVIKEETFEAKPISALQQALRCHLLLFLWYAHPDHIHVSPKDKPDKSDLYERLGLEGVEKCIECRAEDILEFASELEEWWQEQQHALGTTPRGKPLRDVSDEFPTPYYAAWTFAPGVSTPLQQSYEAITRLVGKSLKSPRPDWLTDDDVILIRACSEAARPKVVDPTGGTTWNELPIIDWNYPDIIRQQLTLLHRVVLLEQGTTSSTKSRCPVELRGPGQKPKVLGHEVPELTHAQYSAVKALVDVFPNSLTLDELIKATGNNSGSAKLLRRVVAKDAHWKKVLRLAGEPGMGYQIIDANKTSTDGQ